MATVESRLSAREINQFREDGYLIYNRPVMPHERFAALRTYFEQMLTDLPEGERPEAMDVPHFIHPKLLEFAFDESILSLVEPFTGPNIALFSTHFICKPKGNGRRVPWHEDSAYWKDELHPVEVVTVWLAIDRSLRENGCMMVIPKTHCTGRAGYSDYAQVDMNTNVFSREILKHQRDDKNRVYIELEPNQCSLHDARIMHGSEPNTSSLRRCGFTMRFMSTAVKVDEEAFAGTHVVYLARGRDLGGNKYADPTKAYPDVVRKRAESIKYENSH